MLWLYLLLGMAALVGLVAALLYRRGARVLDEHPCPLSSHVSGRHARCAESAQRSDGGSRSAAVTAGGHAGRELA